MSAGREIFLPTHPGAPLVQAQLGHQLLQPKSAQKLTQTLDHFPDVTSLPCNGAGGFGGSTLG